GPIELLKFSIRPDAIEGRVIVWRIGVLGPGASAGLYYTSTIEAGFLLSQYNAPSVSAAAQKVPVAVTLQSLLQQNAVWYAAGLVVLAAAAIILLLGRKRKAEGEVRDFDREGGGVKIGEHWYGYPNELKKGVEALAKGDVVEFEYGQRRDLFGRKGGFARRLVKVPVKKSRQK
ncbi:MAG: hypothetical protein NTY90_04340, partial [Candidatus Micrarchaeota archaeon]|nr:hypothetical protein [Candidatus Micrarchaeota archaeon]